MIAMTDRHEEPTVELVIVTPEEALLWLESCNTHNFFERLASGADLPQDDPRFVFRRSAARQNMARAVTPQWMTHAILIKAWNAYRQGRRVSALSFRPGGASPERFPEMV